MGAGALSVMMIFFSMVLHDKNEGANLALYVFFAKNSA